MGMGAYKALVNSKTITLSTLPPGIDSPFSMKVAPSVNPLGIIHRVHPGALALVEEFPFLIDIGFSGICISHNNTRAAIPFPGPLKNLLAALMLEAFAAVWDVDKCGRKISFTYSCRQESVLNRVIIKWEPGERHLRRHNQRVSFGKLRRPRRQLVAPSGVCQTLYDLIAPFGMTKFD
jgi:hypothetical protein